MVLLTLKKLIKPEIFLSLGVCLYASTVYAQPVATPTLSIKAQEEQFLVAQIAKDPNSESAHIEYAQFLSGQRRFQEAENEVAVVESLNPNNKLLPIVKRSIVSGKEIQAMIDNKSNPNEVVKKIVGDLSTDIKSIESHFSSFGELEQQHRQAYQQKQQRLREQLEKYGINNYSPKPPSIKELDGNILRLKLRSAGDKEAADKLAKQLIAEPDASVESFVDYTISLLEEGLTNDADSILAQGLVKFPADLKLVIIADRLPKIKSALSTELKKSALDELNDLLSVASQMITERKISEMKSKVESKQN